jgi:hypothetical protein
MAGDPSPDVLARWLWLSVLRVSSFGGQKPTAKKTIPTLTSTTGIHFLLTFIVANPVSKKVPPAIISEGLIAMNQSFGQKIPQRQQLKLYHYPPGPQRN